MQRPGGGRKPGTKNKKVHNGRLASKRLLPRKDLPTLNFREKSQRKMANNKVIDNNEDSIQNEIFEECISEASNEINEATNSELNEDLSLYALLNAERHNSVLNSNEQDSYDDLEERDDEDELFVHANDNLKTDAQDSSDVYHQEEEQAAEIKEDSVIHKYLFDIQKECPTCRAKLESHRLYQSWISCGAHSKLWNIEAFGEANEDLGPKLSWFH
ncbi:hypothetical protein [Parasitella parasitica]|uniref:Uncharacterized protein n=1 Tax=Parasitella parasitica TaxID=35722 RepID=A0A0B7NR44_9FUNG|nr:hypothetical protein [Parasitella parasitica]